MPKFRIIKDGNDLFRVQKRILFLWTQEYVDYGQYYHTATFDTFQEAEQYIVNRLDQKLMNKEHGRNHKKITVIKVY